MQASQDYRSLTVLAVRLADCKLRLQKANEKSVKADKIALDARNKFQELAGETLDLQREYNQATEAYDRSLRDQYYGTVQVVDAEKVADLKVILGEPTTEKEFPVILHNIRQSEDSLEKITIPFQDENSRTLLVKFCETMFSHYPDSVKHAAWGFWYDGMWFDARSAIALFISKNVEGRHVLTIFTKK